MPGQEGKHWKKLCTHYTILTVLLNARSCVGLKGENKIRIGKGGISEQFTSLSSYRKYKGEMFIREGVQPLFTTKKDYL